MIKARTITKNGKRGVYLTISGEKTDIFNEFKHILNAIASNEELKDIGAAASLSLLEERMNKERKQNDQHI